MWSITAMLLDKKLSAIFLAKPATLNIGSSLTYKYKSNPSVYYKNRQPKY